MSVVANVAINVDSTNAVSKLRQVQTQAQATERAFGGISSAANKLQTALAGIGIAGLVLQTSRAAASFNDLKTRLKLLSDQYGEFNKAQQFAAQSATKFGQSNREALAGFTDIYARLKPLGVSLKDIQTTYTGFNTVAKLSGVSAEGASAAFTQLAQALGSGALQGDEFRSIAEQVPGLLAAVSLETGIATKDLKKFASDGKLTSDIIINALRRIETEGAGKLSALVQSSDVQKFKDFQNAVDELSITVGNQLLPVLTPLIKQTTDLISGIAALPQPVLTATGELVKLVVQLLLVQKAIQLLVGLRVGLAGLFASTATGAATAGTASAAATPLVNGLGVALRNLAAIGIITVGVNYVSNVVGEALSLQQLQKRRESGGAAGAFKGASRETVISAQAQQKKELERLRKQEQTRQEKLKNSGGYNIPVVGPIALTAMSPFMVAEQEKIRERSLFAQGVLGLDPSKYKSTTPKPATIPTVPTGGKTGKDGAKAANDAAKLREEQAKELLQAQQGLAISEAELAIAKAVDALKKVELQSDLNRLRIEQEYGDKIKNAKSEEAKRVFLKDKQKAIEIENISKAKEYTDELYRQLGVSKDIADAAAGKAFGPGAQAIGEKSVSGFAPGMPQLSLGLAKKEGAAKTVEDRISTLKDEIKKLTDIGNIAVKVADGIGTAFGQAFQGLISGSMSAREALGSFFKSVGEMFVSMATEIIAKQMTMLVLQLLLKAFGAISGGGADYSGAFKSTPGTSFGDALKMPKLTANGATFANGIAAFANGGIVGSPTLFKFADGGATRTGLMGEAGPEAIMPLSRDGSGRLGVNASGLRDAMAGGNSGGGGSTTLNMSFETTNIGGVEYVSREQLEAAMAQTRKDATRDGAKKGMSMTIDRLQQSPQTRSRVGMR